MPGDITVLIIASQKGDQVARGKLYREVASSLRSIAEIRLRRDDHTLGVDGIVNEAFLQLLNLNRMEFRDREHFTAMANEFMGRILSNYRKWKKALKRGGDKQVRSLHDSVIVAIPFVSDLYELRDALERMDQYHPRQKKALTLYYFDGYKHKEIAELLDISLRSVENDVRFAKTWLAREWNN